MNEIRKNTQAENTIATGNCRIPVVYILSYLLFIILSLIVAIIGFSAGDAATIVGWLFLIIMIVLCLAFVIHIFVIKASHVILTNKRIHGVRWELISRKDFSYRLDQIDSVDLHTSIWGIRTLSVKFNQGYQNSVPIRFSLRYIVGTDFYESLNRALSSVKNERDLKTDIEMKKIEVESRKADILEDVLASKTVAPAVVPQTKKTYIDELRDLKKLHDDQIITDEEFNKRKEEILANADNKK